MRRRSDTLHNDPTTANPGLQAEVAARTDEIAGGYLYLDVSRLEVFGSATLTGTLAGRRSAFSLRKVALLRACRRMPASNSILSRCWDSLTAPAGMALEQLLPGMSRERPNVLDVRIIRPAFREFARLQQSEPR